jgi:hypothetical protein
VQLQHLLAYVLRSTHRVWIALWRSLAVSLPVTTPGFSRVNLLPLTRLETLWLLPLGQPSKALSLVMSTPM